MLPRTRIFPIALVQCSVFCAMLRADQNWYFIGTVHPHPTPTPNQCSRLVGHDDIWRLCFAIVYSVLFIQNKCLVNDRWWHFWDDENGWWSCLGSLKCILESEPVNDEVIGMIGRLLGVIETNKCQDNLEDISSCWWAEKNWFFCFVIDPIFTSYNIREELLNAKRHMESPYSHGIGG